MINAGIPAQINRNVSIALLASLLVHVLILFLLSRQDVFNQHQSVVELPQTITVHLTPSPTQQKPAQVLPPASIDPPMPVAPTHLVHKPQSRPLPVQRTETPEVLAATKPELSNSPSPTPIQTPAISKPSTALDPGQFPDMMAYVKAIREQRNLPGEDAGQNASADAQTHELSEDGIRMANIKRNLQQSGTNGVFHISSMDAHTATFSFRGWTNEYSYSHREEYQVEAGANEDIQRAVVRKMIEIIRRYYTGDFNWESLRLGRRVVLSARLQDNDGLEDFMIREFFR